MPPIADSSLGSRFWITADLRELERLYAADEVRVEAGVPDAVEPPTGKSGKVIGDDAVLTSLASGSDAARFKNAFCRAKLVAPMLAIERNPRELLTTSVEIVAQQLGVDVERMAEKIARLNRFYLPKDGRPAGAITEPERTMALQALGKILLSRDFVSRSHLLKPLDHKGLLALANATLGVIGLVRSGKMEMDRVSDFLLGEVVDITKPGDMLRVAVKTACKAREQFVDAKGIRAAAAEAKRRIFESVDLADPQAASAAAERVSAILQQAEELIVARLAASRKLDIAFDLGDASEKTVKSKLKAAANALRAFRYDYDCVTGRDMGTMERFRRACDDFSVRTSNRTDRVTPEIYQGLRGAEDAFAHLLSSVGEPAIAIATAAQTSAKACELTHATNNHIRYFFSGVETARERFASDVRKTFGPMAERGGVKTVTFEVGADVRGGVNLGKNVTLDARAGGKYVQKATIKVLPGGGGVDVVYYRGGAAEASGAARLGFNPHKDSLADDPDAVRLGVDVHGGGEIGGGRGRAVHYATLEDFIRDCNGESALTRVGIGHTLLCLGKVAQAARAIVRGFTSIVTCLGLRIEKSVADNTAYRAMLQKNGVMGELDALLAGPSSRHVVKTSEKTYDSFQGGFNVGADFSFNVYNGVDASTGKEKTGSLANLGVNFKYSGELQRRVRGREMRAQIDTIRLESDERLRNRLDALLAVHGDMDLDIGHGTESELFARFERALSRIERDAQGVGPDDRDGWRRVCDRLLAITVQYVTVERAFADMAEVERRAGGGHEMSDMMETFRASFESRLASPDLDIPDDIFDEKLVDVTGALSAGRTVNEAELKFSYDAGTSLAADDVKTATDGLKVKDGDSTAVAQLKGLGKVAEGNAVSGGLAQLGAKGTVTGYVRVERGLKQDSRPWKNGKTVVAGIKIEPNMPMRVLVEVLVAQTIDQMTDDPPADVSSLKKKIATDIVTTLIPGVVVEEFVSLYGQMTFGQVAAAMAKGEAPTWVQSFFAGPLVKAMTGEIPLQGLEAGMDVFHAQTIEFRIERGRLASISLAQDLGMTTTLGVRFKAGPVGVGVHMKTGFYQSEIERSVYPHPSFDTMLGRTSDLLTEGGRNRLARFLAHNQGGALKLFAAAKSAFGAGEARGDAADIRARVVTAYELMADAASSADASVRDRARLLINELNASVSDIGSIDVADAAGTRLAAMESLLTAVTRAFELEREAKYKALHFVV